VLDIGLSPNDKFLASSCQDRSLILWPSKHFTSNDHRSTRGNVAYDVSTYLLTIFLIRLIHELISKSTNRSTNLHTTNQILIDFTFSEDKQSYIGMKCVSIDQI
jgi:hypothetical protein